MTRNSNIYEFKYEGDFQAVDALPVLYSQIAFINLITEIKNNLDSSVEINIKLQGLKKGSLEVHQLIELATNAAPGLIFANYDLIKKIFSIFRDLVKIKEFLGSKKADKTAENKNGTVNIYLTVNGGTNHINASQEAFSLYTNNPNISNALLKTGEAINQSKDIEEITVRNISAKTPIVSIDKKTSEKLKEDNPYTDKLYTYDTVVDQVLGIKKPNLIPEKDKALYWDVIHKGSNIRVKITDRDFIAQVNNGLRVGKGDSIKVDIKKTMRFSKEYNMEVETGKYEVFKVHTFIPRNDQSAMDFN